MREVHSFNVGARMHRSIVVATQLMIVVMVVVSCGVSTDTPEQFGEAVVASLQKNDIAAFQKLCGSTQDFIDILKQSHSSELDSEILSLEKRSELWDKELTEDNAECFYKLGEKLTWADLEILRIVTDRIDEDRVSIGMRSIEGITQQVCEIEVYFKGAGSSHLLVKGVKYKDGWKMEYNRRRIEWKFR